ncbi:MAG: hypothetical protein GF308_11645 [Candidatus Heimdallarchaeota archaeon]|nr:hypothetical protein [Candidatus Heimdallarchaeota archaeon]
MAEKAFSKYPWVVEWNSIPAKVIEGEKEEKGKVVFRCPFCNELVALYDHFARCTCGKYWIPGDIDYPECNILSREDFERLKRPSRGSVKDLPQKKQVKKIVWC